MKIIGLTGGSGAGKGTVAKLMESFGAVSYDADKIYHSLIDSESECSKRIIDAFGDEIRNENGGVLTSALSKIVFSDREKLTVLNNIAHKYVCAEYDKIIEAEKKKGTTMFVIDAPQLFESGMNKICDVTVAVISKKENRVERIISRDNISYDRAVARISAQYSDDFFIKNCDYVIENDKDAAHLLFLVKEVISRLKEDG